MKKIFFSIAVILIIVFCSSQKNKERQSDQCQDITNAILNRSSPYSQNYVGKYCATIKDVYYDSTLIANFSIEHAGDKSIWYTDALPNHNFNDKTNFHNRVGKQK